SKNRLNAVLNEKFEFSFDYQYTYLIPLKKGFFKAIKNDVVNKTIQFNGIIDSNNTTIGNFDSTTEIFNTLYKDEIIIHEKNQYFSFHIITKKQRLLDFEMIIRFG